MDHSDNRAALRTPGRGTLSPTGPRRRQLDSAPPQLTLPQPTAMSRSSSNSSHASSRHPGGRSKIRGRRTGRLTKEQAQSAAETRKVGACERCRLRRVKCTHNRSSQPIPPTPEHIRPPAQPGAEHLLAGSPPPLLTRSPVQASLPRQDAASRDLDLRGLSANPANNPLRPPLSTDHDELSELHAAPNGGFSTTHLRGPSILPAILIGSASSPSASSETGAADDRPMVPIGREISYRSDLWECQWPHDSDGTESLVSFTSKAEGASCTEPQHRGLPQLDAHYRARHGAFRRSDRPFMWKCRLCQFMSFHDGVCWKCAQPGGSQWDKFYYGHLNRPEKVASLSTTSASAFTGAPNLGSGLVTALAFTRSDQGSSYSGYTSFSAGCHDASVGIGGPRLDMSLAQMPRSSQAMGSMDGVGTNPFIGAPRVSPDGLPAGTGLGLCRCRSHGNNGGGCLVCYPGG